MDAVASGWTAADAEAGRTLPAHYFYSPEIWERERTRIFFKSWQLVGHLNDLGPEPGSFITHDLLDQSVVVMVGRDGALRAFHNVCQHRGNRLIEARRGRTSAIICGYHAWTYDLDGALQGAPQTRAVPGFDRCAYGLKAVRVELLGGFVFVNLDPNATALADMAPGADAEMRRFLPDLDDLVLIEQTDVPVAANWKVVQENSIEGYHFDYSGSAHKELTKLIDFANYTLEPRGAWWT